MRAPQVLSHDDDVVPQQIGIGNVLHDQHVAAVEGKHRVPIHHPRMRERLRPARHAQRGSQLKRVHVSIEVEDRIRVIVATELEAVVAAPAGELVVARPTGEPVGAIPAGECIGVALAEEPIVAALAGEGAGG
jgi:hypothetical protein